MSDRLSSTRLQVPGSTGLNPTLLLFIPRSALGLTSDLRAHLLSALRRTEPQAELRVFPGGEHSPGCHYRLMGPWARPAAAHAALVFALSGLPEPHRR